MSAITPRRWTPKVRLVLFFIAVVVTCHLVASVTGFGDWLRSTPTAVAIVRILACLLFGSGGLLLLLGGRFEPEFRTRGNRLAGLLLLSVAVANAILLLNGKTTFSKFLSE